MAGPEPSIGARLFRSLGFRWVFPIGTLPVPFHPVLLWALLLSPVVALAAALAGPWSGDTPRWPGFLITAAAIALPLAIPFVSWMLLAFRAPIGQGLFILAGMILIVLDAVEGRTHPGWLVLPAGFTLLWLWQWLGGLAAAGWFRRRAVRFEPFAISERTALLSPRQMDLAQQLLVDGYAPRAFVSPAARGGGEMLIPILSSDGESLISHAEGKLPRGWKVIPRGEMSLLQRSLPSCEDETVAIATEPAHLPLLPRSTKLHRWRIAAPERGASLVVGHALAARSLPIATLFFWTSILGESQWVAGFLPQTRKVTAEDKPDPSRVLLRREASAPQPLAAGLIAEMLAAKAAEKALAAEQRREHEIAMRLNRRSDNITPPRIVTSTKEGLRMEPAQARNSAPPEFWRAVTGDPAAWVHHIATFAAMVESASAADREDLRRALGWLETAIERRARGAVVAAAQYVAEMPEVLLASDYGRIERIFNSRILGMAWHITPGFDVKPLPPRVPKFGNEAGFGLIRTVPELYLKIAQLNPAMEEIVSRLAAEALQYGLSLPDDLAAMAAPPPSGPPAATR